MALESLIPVGLIAMMAGMIVITIIVSIGIWIYTSLAAAAIGRREKVDKPNLAWIPGLGPALIFRKIAKMHWWPFLLLIGLIIPILNTFAMIAFLVFYYIWWWKTTEARKMPGWIVLLTLIPGLGGLWGLVLMGLLAWNKD